MSPITRAIAVLALAAVVGCAHPYRGPKTLAAVGAALVVAGAALWVAGERTDRDALVAPGAIGAGAGAAAILGAGAWLAASITCQADPDCPAGEECREVPAPPGGVPYSQCVRR